MSAIKIVFFDIDGTLLTPYPWKVPDSTRQALKEARACIPITIAL